jgi:hypothetical protein
MWLRVRRVNAYFLNIKICADFADRIDAYADRMNTVVKSENDENDDKSVGSLFLAKKHLSIFFVFSFLIAFTVVCCASARPILAVCSV